MTNLQYHQLRILQLLLSILCVVQCQNNDWLLNSPLKTTVPTLKATTSNRYDPCSLILTNGLISRVFSDPSCSQSTTAPTPPTNWATIDVLDNTPRSALSAMDFEAQIQLNNVSYNVGGFNQTCPLWQKEGQTNDEFSTCTYFNRTQPSNHNPINNPTAFVYSKHFTSKITTPFTYKSARHSNNSPWPPLGLHLQIEFIAPAQATLELKEITVVVHYNIYQGIPVLSKWIEITTPHDAKTSPDLKIGNIVVETMRLNDDFAGTQYATADPWHPDGAPALPLIYPSVNVPYGATCSWSTRFESTYNSNPYLSCATTGITATGATCHSHASPAEVCPGSGVTCPKCGKDICPCPAVNVSSGVHVTLRDASSSYFKPRSSNTTLPFSFTSFQVDLLMFQKTDTQERRGLAMKKVTSILMPWTTENPLFVHLTNTTTAGVKATVDDLHAVGMEMIVQSFGTSFKMENGSVAYLKELAEQTKYGRNHGNIEIGGYDLIVLDRAGLGYDEELIETNNEVGGSACFASKWVDVLSPLIQSKVQGFHEHHHSNTPEIYHDDNIAVVVGLGLIETDGPYGGEGCSATNHSHHHGLEDSVYWQTRLQMEFYQSMRSQGISINAPDRYFASGSNKMMFYGDPTNYGVPRKRDLLLSRQMLFDATYEWLPTQGWSLVPLEPYGVDNIQSTAASTFSPLEENVVDYDYAWAMYMGYGVSGVCWRGKKIFEGPKSQAVVTKWVTWYKKYRDTLTSELLIHVRRPDGQGLDGILHANPKGGMVSGEKERGILFMFNPTGYDIVENVTINLYYTGLETVALLNGTKYVLERDYTVVVEVKVLAESYAWWVVQ